jgi:hypothetical protein
MLNQKYHIATHRSAVPAISGKSSSRTIAAAFGVSALTLAADSAGVHGHYCSYECNAEHRTAYIDAVGGSGNQPVPADWKVQHSPPRLAARSLIVLSLFRSQISTAHTAPRPGDTTQLSPSDQAAPVSAWSMRRRCRSWIC